MKRLTTVLVILAFVVAAAATTVWAGGGAAATKLTLEGRTPAQFGNVDQKPKGDSPGDYFTIDATLYQGARRVGAYDAICFTTSPKARVLCNETLKLADGQIETQASESQHSSTNVAAVVGGTGAYAQARGTVTITDKPNGNVFVLDLDR